MKILVTGATGFIGSFTVPLLLADGHRVYCLKRKQSDDWRTTDWKRRVIWFTASHNTFDSIFTRYHFDCIVHLASKYIKYEKSTRDINVLNETNVLFPTKLLDAAVNHKVKYFINTGSCFEYKESQNPITENSEIMPFNYYAVTKLMFEEILQYYAQTHKLKAVTLRPFFAYGEKDNPKVIPAIIKAVSHHTPLTIRYAESRLNFTYVRDIAEAYRKCVRYITQSSKTYDVINIGTNIPTSLRHIIDRVQTIAKHPASHITIAKSASARRDYRFMTCLPIKARKLLGWEPTYSLDAALRSVYNYYENHE